MSETDKALTVLHETVGVAEKDNLRKIDWRREQDPSLWSSVTLEGLLGLGRDSYRPVAPKQAMNHAVFLACVDVITQDIARTPMRLYTRGAGSDVGDPVPPNVHWLSRKFALDPNFEHTWPEFWAMVVLQYVMDQNAYIAMEKRTNNEVINFIPLVTRHVMPHISQERVEGELERFYEVTRNSDYERVMLEPFAERLLPDEVVHFRGRLFDGLEAVSTLRTSGRTFAMNGSVMDFLIRLYQNDGALRGVFKQPKDVEMLPDEAFERLKRQLSVKLSRMMRLNEALVLEGGLDFEAISMTAEQGEASKMMDAAIEEVCRLMRVPPHKIGHTKAVKYENLDPMERAYARDCLLPICDRIEKRAERHWLTEDERLQFTIQFDREALFYSDPVAMAKLVESMQKYGNLTQDEARSFHNMGPLPNRMGRHVPIPVNIALFDPETGEFKTSAAQTAEKISEQTGQDKDDPDNEEGGEQEERGLRVIRGGR